MPIIDPNNSDHGLSSPKIGSSIFFLGSGEIISRIIAYAGITYIATRLGPEQFGVIGFAVTIYWFLALAVAGGINDIGAQEVARKPSETPSIAANVLIIRFGLALISLTIIGLLALFLNKPQAVRSVIFLTGLLLLPLAVDTSWIYKGLLKNRPVALTLVLSQVLYITGLFLFVKTPQDIAFVPLSQLFGESVAVLILVIPLLVLSEIRINLMEGLKIVQKAGWRTISQLMRTITLMFDTLLIGFTLGERAVGLYTAPYRICFLLLAIANSIHVSYLPIFSIISKLQAARPELGKVAERSIYLAAAIAAPISVGGMIISPLIIEKLFGTEYLEGKNALRFLLLSLGFIFIQGAVHNIFLALNRFKIELLIFSLAAVLNIGLNLLIIPRFGITGAACVTAFTELLTLLMGLIAVYKIDVPLRFGIIWKPVLASLVMGLSLVPFGIYQNLTASLMVGFLTYSLVLIIFRGIPNEVVQLLMTILSYFQFSGGKARKS